MQPDTPLTTTAIDHGLPALLASRRETIDEESRRFVDIGDAEALHDLRVAMRRLHSLFVAFDTAVDPANTFSRRLKQILKQTNHARDLEVSLAILQNNRLDLPWLKQQWQEELEQEYAQLRDTLPAAWQQLAPELDRPETILNPQCSDTSLAGLAAELLAEQRKALKKGRAKLCRKWKDKPAHKLRVLGKQQRYLCEPFAEELPACGRAVDKLKSFQDLLGDYHDIVVMREKLETLHDQEQVTTRQKQLRKACRRLGKWRSKLRKKAKKQYCAQRGKKLEKAIAAAGRSLAKRADTTMLG